MKLKKKTKRLFGYRKWESEAPRVASTSSVGSLINRLFANMGVSDRVMEQQAVIQWPDIVGKEISTFTAAKAIKNGILRVHVENASWRQELTYMKDEICTKINRKIGYLVVKDIKFS